MLGVDQDLAWRKAGEETVIEIPEAINARRPCAYAWAFRIEPERAAP
jgi:hypothetical protein